MSRPHAFRPSHFAAPAALLVTGLVMARQPALSEFFASLYNVLPTLLLLLGAALCLSYGRIREGFMLVVIYLAYFLLDNQVDHYRASGQLRPDAALTFHLCSLLLPLLYGLFGAWRERTHLLQEALARTAVLFIVTVMAAALAQRFPLAVHDWLVEIRWPMLQLPGLTLIQLAYPAFLLAWVALLIQYLRQPRPTHAAGLVALVTLLFMLPQTFAWPFALNVLASHAMLMLVGAIAHEAYLMAFRDELTGLPGRRALNERLQRLGRSYVVAMAGVDHFKAFNDTHGHDVGDQVLRLVASRLSKVGGGGRAYRYGGEEFTLLFPGRCIEQCLPYLESVRQAIEEYPLQLRDRGKRPSDDRLGRQARGRAAAASVSVTISIGVAAGLGEQRSAEDVIKAADQALYAAKKAGRNCVRVHGAGRGAVRTGARPLFDR
ncbi:GGDEF domain-containing protein [Stutzerimonas balearica]|uniref:GGDEF domain-containing protein n=1 Tax=Stutzerimonas balearica TaxID=74829 RepID=UPI0024201281|nr:GGDEF domain-containing protein [Stutzerimonas balearica]